MTKAWRRTLLSITLTLGACSSDDDPPGGEHLAVVRGTLADPATARADHDGTAAAVEAHATELGDIGHTIGLGASIFDTGPHEFVAIDRWAEPDNMDEFYGDPNFRAGLEAQVDNASVQHYRRRADWYGWGDAAAASGGPRWFALVQAEFADPPTAQEGHDRAARAAESAAAQLGDRAHLVFTGRDDERAFLALDIWESPSGIAAFYGDPGFQQSATELFTGPPVVTVFHSTNWHQWGVDEPVASLDGAWQVTSFTCDGAAMPIGDFSLTVRAAAGVFVQAFDPGCVATLEEEYVYAQDGGFEIAPLDLTCDPSDTCDAVLGASCLPPPLPTRFDWELDGERLTFRRTAEGPVDFPCEVGDQVEFTLERNSL